MRQMHRGRERDKVGLAHAHGNVVCETNESRGVGDLIGDTNNCVCSTILLSFCFDACRIVEKLSELSGKAAMEFHKLQFEIFFVVLHTLTLFCLCSKNIYVK